MNEPILRVSDAERETVADRLRHAHADGRLDTSELEERIARCYSAKTRAELEPLVADLPVAPRRRERRRHTALHPGMPGFRPLLLLPLLLVVFVLADADRIPFPLFPLLLFMFVRFGLRQRRPYR